MSWVHAEVGEGLLTGPEPKTLRKERVTDKDLSHPEVKIVDASTAKHTLSWEETPERRLF